MRVAVRLRGFIYDARVRLGRMGAHIVMVAYGAPYLGCVRVVRVATFNIRHGRGLDDAVDLHRTAEAIRATQAPLVALQEIDRNSERSDRVDQPRRLEQLTGMNVHFAPTVRRGESEYGIALASAEPIPAQFEALPRVGEEEPRGMLIASWEGLSIVATHLSTRRAARKEQTRTLAARATSLPPPVAVLGDLNQGRAGLRPLRRLGFDPGRRRQHTLTARSLRWEIDFVLAGPGCSLVHAATETTDASDHVPLVAEIAISD